MKENRWSPEDKQRIELFTLRKRVNNQRRNISKLQLRIKELEARIKELEDGDDRK